MPASSRSASPGTSGKMCSLRAGSTVWPLSSAITSWNRAKAS